MNLMNVRRHEEGPVAMWFGGVDWADVLKIRDDLDLSYLTPPTVSRDRWDRAKAQLDEARRDLESAKVEATKASADYEESLYAGVSPWAAETALDQADARVKAVEKRIPILERLVREAGAEYQQRANAADREATDLHKDKLRERHAALEADIVAVVGPRLAEVFAIQDALRRLTRE